MKPEILEGARNCVVNCARVRKDNEVLVLNQAGSVDAQVSDALAQVAAENGAQVHVLWGESIPKSSDELPKTLIGALVSTDVAIVTYPSLRREILHPHLKDKEVIRSGNAARTVELMASEWARFPFSLEQAIIDKLDVIMARGRLWRITTPQGTDVKGEFAGKNSVIAGAYFERDEGDTRFSRAFPGGVHTPFNSVNIEGVIVIEHLSGLSVRENAVAVGSPFRIELKDNRIISIDGEDKGAEILKRQIQERKEGIYHLMDSWHAGTNPKGIAPYDRKQEPRLWWNYAHWNPSVLHFHLGQSVNPISLACFKQTVQVDGRKVYEDGRLTIADDVEEVAKRYSAELLENSPLPI